MEKFQDFSDCLISQKVSSVDISVFNFTFLLFWQTSIRNYDIYQKQINNLILCVCVCFCAQVDKILKVIPRDRRTFLFSATMTKKVGGVPVLLCVSGFQVLLIVRRANGGSQCILFLWFTGPETTESSPERPCQVCSLEQIFHSRQTSAVLHFHTIKVQGRLQAIVHCFVV